MNASEAKVLSDIEKVGWHVILVPEDDEGTGFAFTIGLHHSYGHPEIIMFGLPPKVMHAVLNLVGEATKSGRRFAAGDRVDNLLDGYECTFVSVPRSAYGDFLGYARWYYKGDEFPALQCVWPDASGHFPWEVDGGWVGGDQPVLGITPSVDTSKPAINRHFKTGHFGSRSRQVLFTSVKSPSASPFVFWSASFAART